MVRLFAKRILQYIHNLNLKTKIFLSFSIFAYTLILFGLAYFSAYAVKITNNQTEESFYSSVLKASEALENILDQCDKESRLISDNQLIINYLDSYDKMSSSEQLSAYTQMKSSIKAIENMSESNVRIYIPEYKRFLNDQINFFPFDSDFEEKLIDRNKDFSGWKKWSVMDSETLKWFVLHRVRPIYSKINYRELLGIACIGISAEKFSSVIENLRLITGTQAYIIDAYGNAIAYLNSDENNTSVHIEFNPKEMLHKNDTYYTKNIILDGKYYLRAFKKIGDYDLYITTILPQNKLTQNMKNIWRDSLIIAIFAASITLLISYLISRSISTRVSLLTKAMTEYTAGELFVPLQSAYEDDIGILINTYNMLVDRINHLIHDVYMADVREKEAQIKFLRAQINPHFLYNTLNLINCMAMEKKTEQMSEVILALSNFIHISLREERSNSLMVELSHAKSYLDICRYRYGDRISMTVNIEKSFLDVEIPSLTIQPIIENCILHGLRETGENLNIHISAQTYEDMLVIDITDNGKGMDENTLKEVNSKMNFKGRITSGYGLHNVQQRLKLMYGDSYGINLLSSKNKGTSCILTLPLSV